MKTLSAYSLVAGQEFKNGKEVDEFFFQEDFLENYNSVDIDFAINFESLTGKEVRYNQAKKAFEILKGIPATFNHSGMGLRSKLSRFRKAFEPSPMIVPKVEVVTSEVVATMFKTSLSKSIEKLSPISSYINNKVFSAVGLNAIENYFIGNRTISITLATETNEGTEDIAVAVLGKDEFKSLLTRSIHFHVLDTELKTYSNHHLKMFKTYVTANLSEYDLEQVNGEVMSDEEIEHLTYSYKKPSSYAIFKYDYTPNKDLTRRMLHQLKIFIDRKEYHGINNMCSLIGHYKEYILNQYMFTKSQEAVDKENQEHMNGLLNIKLEL